MNETENKQARQEADHTPPPADPTQVLSPRRRSALVTYLAILFAVAFLFVAVMMVMEAKRLKTMNQELQDSSQKTSASLTNNINALQAENQQLSQTNEELTARIAALEAEAETAAGEQAALQTRLEQQMEELAARETELTELRTQAEALNQKAEDAVSVSELLQKALAANEDGDMEGLKELLDQIEPLKELLSETETELFESLTID